MGWERYDIPRAIARMAKILPFRKRRGRGYSFMVLSRREFVITEAELRLMAAAASTGLNNKPKNGYSTPAAIGTPSAL
jgi:hypothetical protein